MPRRVLTRLVVLGIAIASLLCTALPSSATNHTCGDVWCSGSDGSTPNNIQGGNPQIYLGEVGVYYHDFGTQAGPCPNDPFDGCFSSSGAQGAKTRFLNDDGLGVQFYYLGGGSTSQWVDDWGSPYCFGWRQGFKAVNHAYDQYAQYIPEAWLLFLDIEQNDTFEWSSQYPDRNRHIINGFRDYVQGASSDDPSNCNYTNQSNEYQHGYYSAPSQWTYSFGSSGSLTRTPLWTYDDCCHEQWPGDFHYSDSEDAKWFGGSDDNDNHDIWQFNQTPDRDIALEPIYLPWFDRHIGT